MEGWGRDEKVDGIEVCLFYLTDALEMQSDDTRSDCGNRSVGSGLWEALRVGALRSGYTHLGFDIKETSATALGDVTDSHERGAVVVAGELGVFDKGMVFDQFLEFFAGDKVVVFAVLFTWPRRASGVCVSLMGGKQNAQNTRNTTKTRKTRGTWDDDTVRHDETEKG